MHLRCLDRAASSEGDQRSEIPTRAASVSSAESESRSSRTRLRSVILGLFPALDHFGSGEGRSDDVGH
jgi:hypothetical protein